MPNLRSMRAAFVKVQLVLLGALLLTLSTASLFGKEKNHAPLPAQVITAKTVYIDNQSEETDVGEKARDELSKWGRFQLVSNRAEADLIFVFSTSAYTSYATSSPPYSGEVEANYTYLTIIDGKSASTCGTLLKNGGIFTGAITVRREG